MSLKLIKEIKQMPNQAYKVTCTRKDMEELNIMEVTPTVMIQLINTENVVKCIGNTFNYDVKRQIAGLAEAISHREITLFTNLNLYPTEVEHKGVYKAIYTVPLLNNRAKGFVKLTFKRVGFVLEDNLLFKWLVFYAVAEDGETLSEEKLLQKDTKI